MKSGFLKDRSYRSLFLKKERKLRVISCIRCNSFLPVSWRTGAVVLNQGLGAFRSKLTNFCVYSYRSRGVLKSFKVSRHVLKNLVSRGEVPGYKKSSW